MDDVISVRVELEEIVGELRQIHDRVDELKRWAEETFPDQPASERETGVTLSIRGRSALANGQGFLLKSLESIEKAVRDFKSIERRAA